MKTVKKILITAAIMTVILGILPSLVSAQITEIVEDPEDDVIAISSDEQGEVEQFVTDEVPSADIVEVSYEREIDGTEVTVSFKVNDRGKIETMDLEELEDIESFFGSILPLAYSIMVITDQSDYEIVFQNNESILNYEEELEFTVVDNEFSTTFHLNSANETITDFGAQSFFMKFSLAATTIYMDAAPDSFMFMAEIVAPDTAIVGDEVSFTGFSYNIADMMGLGLIEYNYNWDFDDGSTGSGETVTHSYQLPGTYTVRLTVSDSEGAETTTTHTITVDRPPESPIDENGPTDENGEDSPILMFILILGIIVVIGIIALVVVIRR